MNELIKKVEQWSIERNLHVANPQAQTLKVVEEFTETLMAHRDNNVEEVIDGIGDTYVTLIILCKQLDIIFLEAVKRRLFWDEDQVIYPTEALNWLASGVAKVDIDSVLLGVVGVLVSMDGLIELYKLTPEQCLSVAYNEIKDRTGKMVNGTFIKSEDLQ